MEPIKQDIFFWTHTLKTRATLRLRLFLIERNSSTYFEWKRFTLNKEVGAEIRENNNDKENKSIRLMSGNSRELQTAANTTQDTGQE